MDISSNNISTYKNKQTKKWMAQVPIGYYDNGQRKYKRFSGDKRRDVIEKANKYLALENNNDIYSDAIENITLADYMEYYLLNIKKKSLQPSSYDRECRTVRLQILDYIGFYRLVDLTCQIIQEELIEKLIEKNYSHSSIKKAYNSLNSALNYAVKTKRLRYNPCINVVMPKESLFDKEEIRFFNEEEIKKFKQQALKKTAHGIPLYKHGKAILLALYTGVRVGELCALRWSDIDFNSNIMRVNKISTTTYEKGTRSTSEAKRTKTVNGLRYVNLNKSAIDILKDIKNSKLVYDENNYIVGNSSTIYSVDAISGAFTTIANAAGIYNPRGIHTLRHTFATMLIYKGVDIKVVSELLGHSSITITYNLYVHVLKEQKAKAINLIDF